jgi:hypothetical protein
MFVFNKYSGLLYSSDWRKFGDYLKIINDIIVGSLIIKTFSFTVVSKRIGRRSKQTFSVRKWICDCWSAVWSSSISLCFIQIFSSRPGYKAYRYFVLLKFLAPPFLKKKTRFLVFKCLLLPIFDGFKLKLSMYSIYMSARFIDFAYLGKKCFLKTVLKLYGPCKLQFNSE